MISQLYIFQPTKMRFELTTNTDRIVDLKDHIYQPTNLVGNLILSDEGMSVILR